MSIAGSQFRPVDERSVGGGERLEEEHILVQQDPGVLAGGGELWVQVGEIDLGR